MRWSEILTLYKYIVWVKQQEAKQIENATRNTNRKRIY